MAKQQAGMYVRVSTDKQDTKRQINELKELAQSQGFHIPDDAIFSENISGFKKGQDRPVFSKFLNQVRENPKLYSKLYIHEISRLARDPNEGRRLLDELSDLGVSIFVKSINLESLTKDGKPNFIFTLIFTVLIEFAQQEAEYTRMRSKSGMRDKVIQNNHIGAGIMRPYGFKGDENKKLVIDLEESKVVKELFKYSLNGMGTKQIAVLLNSKGIKTRLQKSNFKGTLKMRKYEIEKTRDELKWVDGTVYSILKNPIYKGERMYKGEIIKIPAIIEPNTWNQVQEQMTDRFNEKSGNIRYLYLLGKGLATCGKCGKNYVAHYRAGGKDAYYHCSSKRDGKGCGNTGVSIEALESVIYDLLKDSPKVYEHVKRSKHDVTKIEKEIANTEAQLEVDKAVIKEKESELERCINMYMKGIMTEARLNTETMRINRSLEATKRNQELLKVKIKTLRKTQLKINNIQTYGDALLKLMGDRFQMQTIFQSLIDKVSVRAVNEYNNNTQWIVSVWFKGMSEPNTILLQTSRFRKPNSKFIDKGLAKALGQNWIKYFPSVADEGVIKYDKKGVLKTPVENAMELMFELDDEKAKDWSLNEVYPLFVPFQEINLLEKKEKKKVA